MTVEDLIDELQALPKTAMRDWLTDLMYGLLAIAGAVWLVSRVAR